MSVEVGPEQVISPAQDSLQTKLEPCLDDWRRGVRARVTALKCHIMASKGLTPTGEIIEPFSPEILLKADRNAIYLENEKQEDLDIYVAAAMARLPHPNTQENGMSDIALDDVHINFISENSSITPPIGSQQSPTQGSSLLNLSSKAASASNGPSLLILSSNTIESSIQFNGDVSNLKDSKNNNNEKIDKSKSENEYEEMKIELLKKEKMIEKLTRIRDEVESELQDLTANLFQEAHIMVQGANQRAANAEKALKEASMQVEVLQAEVAALKTLVITSTPSSPNPHLHPQLISRGAQAMAEAGKIFHRGHKKSPSDFDLKYGRDTTPPSSPLKEGRLFDPSGNTNGFPLDPDCWEVDPVLHREFVAWRQDPALNRDDAFMARVYAEDIDLCLAFPNSTLAHKVQKAIEENALYIEEVNPRQKNSCPMKCVLLDVPRYCKYRFRLGDMDDTWYYISQLARNRIIAVCDFLSYLRYIQLGLVKSSIHDVYWEIVKLRKQMSLARLGF